MNTPKDPLDNLLDRWGEATPQSDRVEPEVWRRIALAETAKSPSFLQKIKIIFSRPSFSIAFGTACVLLGLFLVQLRVAHKESQRNIELTQSYLRLVNPLMQAQTAAAPEAVQGKNLDSLLAWMKDDLKLSSDQLARIRAVHEQFGPHLNSLSTQVAQMQRALADFEQVRRSIGQVDFVEFARFVERQRVLDRECSESTRRLIAESSNLMTPEQKAQYLQILTPTLKNPAAGSL